MTFCKYPPKVLHLCAKCPPNLKIYIFFLSISKDIKVKQLTVNFNNLNFTILQSKIHTKNSQKGLKNA